MRTIFLDIETWTPGWVEGEAGWKPDTFAPHAYHDPVVFCWLMADVLRTGDVSMRLESHRTDEVLERTILGNLANDFEKARRLVTWNGRGFDMPILALRAMVHGLDWRFWHDWRHRYPNHKRNLLHWDLKDQLGDYGAAGGFRQDRVAKVLGLPGKPQDIDGSRVHSVWKEGQSRQRVLEYCELDVMDLCGIYIRFARSFLGMSIKAAAGWSDALDRLRKKVAEERPW